MDGARRHRQEGSHNTWPRADPRGPDQHGPGQARSGPNAADGQVDGSRVTATSGACDLDLECSLGATRHRTTAPRRVPRCADRPGGSTTRWSTARRGS